MTEPAASRPRYSLVDLARGGAIVAMVVYHFAWDLSYYRLIGIDVSTDPVWTAFARVILSTFLLLAGFGLVLAHHEGMRWPAFWRREAIVAGAALLVSLGTWFAFGPALAFFGVLHVIALASLIALPFLRAPLWVTLLGALVFLIPPRLVRFEAFNDPILAWIGFWTEAPPSADLVPAFPWAGMLLLGVIGGWLFLRSDLLKRAARVTLGNGVLRGIALAGRWSLVIYLLHQPLLTAALYPVAEWLRPAVQVEQVEFSQSCQQSCELGGGEAGFCTRYCACALEQIETGVVGDFTAEAPKDLMESAGMAQMATLCSAIAADDPPEDN
jgi:uncharacterized membrane protein